MSKKGEEQQSKKKKSTTKHLEEQIKNLTEELNEKHEKYLRACADISNIQKRNARQREQTLMELKKYYLDAFIELSELLNKAQDDPNPQHGLNLIHQQLQHFLKKEDLQPINSIGLPFNHEIHHAVSTIETTDQADGNIIDEIKKGYMLGDCVFRPSQVIVASNPTSSSPQTPDEEPKKQQEVE